ncbi:hypothetical protein [Aquimarina algicola]|uniref:Uncharacterized protein n=1 Tax=Aquimarina algicola TaxID=2589995 RepID=A0A504JEU9_9FLAO|nr:hypothetical protein [Aquimarina algicola]TPN86975.1 hypothetical protein FHK87_05115 [Aquimarina algicola]
MKINNVIVIILILITSVACSPAINVRNTNARSGIMRVKQFTNKPTTLMWAHHDPTQRQTLMYVDENGNIKILAEQSPDAGLSRNLNLTTKAKVEGTIDAEVAIKTAAELEKLTNRTTSLMITRESLYRLAEMYFNGAIDKGKYEILFKEVINQTKELIKEEAKLEEQKANIANTEMEKLKLDLEKSKKKENLEKDKPKESKKKSEN